MHPIKARTLELREEKKKPSRPANWSMPIEPYDNRAARRRIQKWKAKHG